MLFTALISDRSTQRAHRSLAVNRAVSHQDTDEATQQLFVEMAQADGVERQRLLDQVVTLNLNLAKSIARRYSGRGEDTDDLVQVASLALVKAARRFDPDKGESFSAFAIPTITGEIKRHFRDLGWTIRPPRRIQELQAETSLVSAQLAQVLRRWPQPDEIAQHLGANPDDVRAALGSRGCFSLISIDNPAGDDHTTAIRDLIGEHDPNYRRTELINMLAPACRKLSERDQRILRRRFIDGWTQREIADELGVSQMQVSRLLSGIFARLRTTLGIPEPTPSKAHGGRRAKPDKAR